ncbi:cellulose binding domain-containing protein [Catellatospora methionotrophica]|uniref:cellulose binding domain-containing protein n=1 Tax=Catellatospora methionotrophica TaxID=121620 RepID=UPI00140E2ED4|nr:cellulose binding domain-containing protein [Catellatospora methionotrophica]
MSKHRLHEDDETTLLPRTVEDPAQEPAPRPAEPTAHEEPVRRRVGRQPLVIGVATMCLLVSGAAAWALAKPAPEPSTAPPTSGASATGAGFTDGFGVMTPSAGTLPEVPPARPSASPSTAPSASPPASPAPGSSGPRPSSPPVAAPPPASGTATATYDVNSWGGGYVISVRVRNTGTAPLAWTVRIQLPQGATVDGDWEADRSGQDGVWTFTPERGDLAPGASLTFGFIGRRGQGDFPVTCTVNGVACQAD